MALKIIFGPKRDEVLGGWRKLHNEELHNMYCSPCIIRIIKSRSIRWAGNVARMGEKRNAYRISVGKPEGKRPLRRYRCRWEDNIKIDLREIGLGGMDWIDLAQDMDQWMALLNTIENGCATGGSSRKAQLHGVSFQYIYLLLDEIS
jgi:hypothetical protein